jgi:cAMP phosphodiesterase
VAIDAGALAAALTLEEQNAVRHVFLTHAHWDHVRDLPLHVINRGRDTPTLHVHGLAETLDAVHRHLMNDVVWFRAFDLPSAETPFVARSAVTPGQTVDIDGYRMTSFPVPHTVPATSWLADDGTCSVLVCADTGGGGIFRGLPRRGSPLKAVFLEASFPNRMREFAETTGHLTPEMLARECADLPENVEVLVTHMKPGFEIELAREIADIGRGGIRPCRDGDVFEF